MHHWLQTPESPSVITFPQQFMERYVVSLWASYEPVLKIGIPKGLFSLQFWNPYGSKFLAWSTHPYPLPNIQCDPMISASSCTLAFISAVDKPEFMGRPPDHPWWKTGSPESLLGCPNYFDLSFKDIFLVINTKFACFLFHQVPTYRELGFFWNLNALKD